MKKKLLILLAVMVIACSHVYAVSDTDKIENIETLLPSLTDFEKTVLYYKYIKEPGTGAMLNTSVGLGIGSFVMGDKVGGGIGLGGELAGYSLMLTGQIMMDAPETSKLSDPDMGMILKYTGMAVVGITKVFEMIRPYTYCEKFNQQLWDAFGIRDIVVVPALSSENRLGTKVTAAVGF